MVCVADHPGAAWYTTYVRRYFFFLRLIARPPLPDNPLLPPYVELCPCFSLYIVIAFFGALSLTPETRREG